MAVELLEIGGRDYLAALDWEWLPAVDATPGAIHQSAKSRRARYGYVRRDDAQERVVLGLTDRATAPSAAVHLAESMGNRAVLYIEAVAGDDASGPQRYWIVAVRDGHPDPVGDLIVGSDESLKAELSQILSTWAPMLGFENIETYTNSEQLAQDLEIDVSSFTDLTGDVDYESLQLPEQVTRDNTAVRYSAYAIAIVAVAWMGWTLFSGDDEPDFVEYPDITIQTTDEALAVDEDAILAEEPEEPIDPAIVRFVEAVEGALVDYHAPSRLARILATVEAAPRYAGGWRLEQASVDAAGVTFRYARYSGASVALLLNRLGDYQLVDMSPDASVAEFQRRDVEGDADIDAPEVLHEARGRWPLFLDQLLLVDRDSLWFQPVLDEDVLEEISDDQQVLGSDPAVDDGIIEAEVMEDAMLATEDALLERYRWGVEISAGQFDQMVRLLSTYDNLLLVRAEFSFLDNREVTFEGAWYEFP